MTLSMATPPWRVDLKAAAVLGLAGALATAVLFPYLLQLMPETLEHAPLPLPLLAAAQSLQAFMLLGALALAGLRMGHRLGLGAPWLQRACGAEGETLPRPAVSQALLLGIGSGALVLLGAHWIDPWLPPMVHPPKATPAGLSALTGLLASLYGGIVEELQLRLFLMTLMLWVAARLRRRLPGDTGFRIALVLAAVLFGAGHLPAAAHLWGLDTIVVLRTLVLNALVGGVCGWLYWRRGLEMAMLAHFSADLVLHMLAPLLSAAAP
ncbi:CPBP family intramembrane glutamic endopeptidase [Stenotrophomonas mori]|uniref:CPBP family intramembrane metalloprotease n=1 Tax=Stenotrophomonas mori TaxID=2871096 RepID=A0ABT0SH11_9GAMM|nr:CPBP family intramembrane glutamic endopeptidase [Stenotrophomonas mori]MCL7714358.1 CPBP family intramembrane metalloprotease [Stenotrophomonas mori]